MVAVPCGRCRWWRSSPENPDRVGTPDIVASPFGSLSRVSLKLHPPRYYGAGGGPVTVGRVPLLSRRGQRIRFAG